MSGKTEAELEAEITELKARVAELERDNRYLREKRNMAFEDAEWEQYRLDVIGKVHSESITKYVDYRNEVAPKLNAYQLALSQKCFGGSML